MKYAVIRTKKQDPGDCGFYTDCFEVIDVSDSLEEAEKNRKLAAQYAKQDIEDYLIIQVW